MSSKTNVEDPTAKEMVKIEQQVWTRYDEYLSEKQKQLHNTGEASMSIKQIVVTVGITPIIAQAFIEGQCIDIGISQSLLTRIFRDHLQAVYPKLHISVGYHDSPMVKLRVHSPSQAHPTRDRVRAIFRKILERENWLVALQ